MKQKLMVDDITTELNDKIRHPDKPTFKDKICAQLFGQFEGFMRTQKFTKDVEYATHTSNIFEVSTRTLHLDKWNPNYQIVLYTKSLNMEVGFGVCQLKNGKATKNVVHRHVITDLRYNISPKSKFELTPGSQKKFDNLFTDFEKWFLHLSDFSYHPKTSPAPKKKKK